MKFDLKFCDMIYKNNLLYKLLVRMKSNEWLLEEIDIQTFTEDTRKFNILNAEAIKRGICKGEYNG